MVTTLLDLKTSILDAVDLPSTNPFTTDARLTDMVNSSLSDLYNILVAQFEDYFVRQMDLTITSGSDEVALDGLHGPQDLYKALKLQYIDGSTWYDLPRWHINDIGRDRASSLTNEYLAWRLWSGYAPYGTNRLLQSEAAGTTWTQTNLTSVTANVYQSPNDQVFLDGLIGTVTDATHGITQTITLPAGSVELSVVAKSGGVTWLYLGIAGISNATAYFDLANGATGTVGAGCTATITALANGCYKCAITGTAQSISSAVYVYGANANGDNDWVASTTIPFTYVGMMQCGPATYASKVYVPTTTAISSAQSYQSIKFSGNPSSGTLRLFYIPTLPKLSADTDVVQINLPTSWLDFVIYDVCARIYKKADLDPKPFEEERERFRATIMMQAKNRMPVEATYVLDASGRNI